MATNFESGVGFAKFVESVEVVVGFDSPPKILQALHFL
jgi:hypothetical protein